MQKVMYGVFLLLREIFYLKGSKIVFLGNTTRRKKYFKFVFPLCENIKEETNILRTNYSCEHHKETFLL